MSEYTKPCTTCKQQIRMSNNAGGKWLPYNLDGSPHRCLPADRYTPKPTNEQKQQPLSLEQIDARLKRVESLLFNEGK
jgi:hypothetical protein